MPATLEDLIQRQRSFLRDSGGGFIDDTDLVAWTNEAQVDLAARTQVLLHEVAATATGNITFPTGANPDMVDILSLRLGADDVEFVSDVDFNIWVDRELSPPHTIGRVFDGVIELFPMPTNSAYVLRYAKIPEPLVNGADVHELPVHLERKLVEYAVAQAKLKDASFDESDRWFMRYEQGLPPVNSGRGLLQPGPMSLLVEPGPFDLDPGARHV